MSIAKLRQGDKAPLGATCRPAQPREPNMPLLTRIFHTCGRARTPLGAGAVLRRAAECAPYLDGLWPFRSDCEICGLTELGNNLVERRGYNHAAPNGAGPHARRGKSKLNHYRVAALLAFHCAVASSTAANTHPFLFVTPADIARAREGVQQSPVFAGLAKELTARATTNRVEDLPPLERDWWQIAKQKPWRDTYPEVFHHTWIVPLKWADLARNCARANLVSPSSSAHCQKQGHPAPPLRLLVRVRALRRRHELHHLDPGRARRL